MFSSSCTIGSFSRRAQLHEWVSEWNYGLSASSNICVYAQDGARMQFNRSPWPCNLSCLVTSGDSQSTGIYAPVCRRCKIACWQLAALNHVRWRVGTLPYTTLDAVEYAAVKQRTNSPQVSVCTREEQTALVHLRGRNITGVEIHDVYVLSMGTMHYLDGMCMIG
jgi:hypothetical protein